MLNSAPWKQGFRAGPSWLGHRAWGCAVVRDSGNGGVQSVQRAFEILEVMASAGGGALALSEIATATGRPAPSIHRLIRTLVELGYVRQDSSRRYALAPGLIRLGDGAARQFGTWAEPLLTELVNTIGETANMAILEGTQALYVAQVPAATRCGCSPRSGAGCRCTRPASARRCSASSPTRRC